MKIIFDYNRTIFNPEADSLYQGVVKLLQDLSKKNELFLISRNEPGRKNKLKKLGIEQYFENITFVEEKTIELFKELAQGDKNILVIGDRVKEEICIGNQLNFITIWVQQGKFANELPTKSEEKPSFTVKNIEEIKNIVSQYEN